MKFKLQTNNRKISGKFPNIWKSNNMLLNNSWFKEEAKKIARNILIK
jgi:hypothetical protein